MRVLVYFKKEQDLQQLENCGIYQNRPPEFVVKSINGWCYRMYIQSEDFIQVKDSVPRHIMAVTEGKRQTVEQNLATIPKPKPKPEKPKLTKDEEIENYKRYLWRQRQKKRRRCSAQ